MTPQYVTFSNFVPRDVYKNFKAAIPPMDQVQHSGRSHKDLYEYDPLFQATYKTNIDWQRALTFTFKSPEFWGHIIQLFDPAFMQDLNFDFHKLPFKRDFDEGRPGALAQTEEPFLYPRIDIGYGVQGYGKDNGGCGPHIDFPQRLISALWYFTPQAALEGGELEVYEKFPGPEPTKESGYSNVRRIECIPVQENKAVFMLQDAHAWHAVNPVIECSEPRIAVYAALSCSKPIWKTR